MNSLITLVHGLFQYDSCSGDHFSSLLSSMLGYRLQQWNTLYFGGSKFTHSLHRNETFLCTEINFVLCY